MAGICKAKPDIWQIVVASSVILVTEDQGVKFSARNRLPGTVSRVTKGAVNSEVVLDLQGGASVAAIVTNESINSLGLQVGSPTSAMFKVSNVIIGVRT